MSQLSRNPVARPVVHRTHGCSTQTNTCQMSNQSARMPSRRRYSMPPRFPVRMTKTTALAVAVFIASTEILLPFALRHKVVPSSQRRQHHDHDDDNHMMINTVNDDDAEAPDSTVGAPVLRVLPVGPVLPVVPVLPVEPVLPVVSVVGGVTT
jgi:hypothetical protein